ncbi:phosphotransferase [Natrialbaceae archaeon A-CW2]
MSNSSVETDLALLQTVIDTFERGDPSGAIDSIVETAERPNAVLNDLFGVGHEGWYTLISDEIGGDCLDISSGFGRHIHLLGALVDTLYTLEPDPHRVRFLQARVREEEQNIVPVQGDEDSIPFKPESLDTIISRNAPLEGSTYSDRLEYLYSLLATDGSLVIELDGLTRVAGLTHLAGLETRDGKSFSSLLHLPQALLSRYNSCLERAGFESVQWYAICPTDDCFEWIVPLESDAIGWLLATQKPSSTHGKLLHATATVASRAGLLHHLFPTYLAVCQKQSDSNVGPTNELLRRGATRSIVFEIADGSIRRVRKPPNDPRHAHFNERAEHVLSHLQAGPTAFAATIPTVSLEASDLGPVLVDEPMRGKPLRKTVRPQTLREDPESFDRMLRIGLDWLEQLNANFSGRTQRLSPEQAQASLSIEALDFVAPTPASPVQYQPVPQHGDFHPGNVAVDQSRTITSVIDWEYATLAGDPVADPAFYAVKLAEYAYGDLERGFTQCFVEPTAHSQVVYDRLRSFCVETSIDPTTFAHYIGSSYVDQIATHFAAKTPYRYHTTPRNKLAVLNYLYTHVDTVRNRLSRGIPSQSVAAVQQP